MFEKAIVEIELIEPMLGTVPKDPEVYKTYIESKKPEEVSEDESKTVEKTEAKGWTGFHADEGGLFIYDYMIKGFLKSAGNNLKDTVKVKNLRSKLNEFLFVKPRRIHLGGQTEPDGVLERPLRAQTMQGPRVTLARSDYINAGMKLKFEIHWIAKSPVTFKMIETLFAYGEYKGIGQFRNGSYGQFKVLSIKKLK